MSENDVVKTSKFLSYILRHNPESIGIRLNDQGWANVDELITASRKHGRRIDKALIQTVVAENDKKRFALSDDGTMIRAVQGHSSTTVKLDYTPETPPDTLFHGTATRFLSPILSQGLVPRGRHHVHLSANEKTAIDVGKRHGKPVVLRIESGRMHSNGYQFYLAENGVWLTSKVPIEYLSVIE